MAKASKVKDRAETGADKGQALFDALRGNPYVQRLIADDDLRTQLRDAVQSSRSAYGRASGAKRPTQALLKDKKLQRDLKAAFASAKSAQEALREAPSKPKGRRKGGLGRVLVLAAVGGVVAIVASSDLRDKVLDLLFGPEETFDYVPTSNGNGTGAAAATTESPATKA